MMRYNLLSIVAGSEVCNARCPFCVSKMTPSAGIERTLTPVNWRNFRIATRLAQASGVTTAMITSKGEATLFPAQVTEYLGALKEARFPVVELQTNGIPLAEDRADRFLKEWYDHDLSLVAISIVHYDREANRSIYLPHKREYIDLERLIGKLHGTGFSVRLACIMLNEYIDRPSAIEELIAFTRANKVEQLTIRPVHHPDESRDPEAKAWTIERALSREQHVAIERYLDDTGMLLQQTAYGARIYDVHGQNVCLTNSLTAPRGEDVRQLIFFPDGHLRYDWQHEGAIIL